MLTILLHSSKTMRLSDTPTSSKHYSPDLIDKTTDLASYIQTLSSVQLAKAMQLSPTLADKTHQLWQHWTTDPARTRPAIDSFLGDIYSGLQVSSFTTADRLYAHRHLLILSGLYGGLHALDGIAPYRLEMGYRLPDMSFSNLYKYWAASIADLIPAQDTIINLSAVEYTKAVLPHLGNQLVITPRFLTVSPKTGQPTFVTVHAKIARGAFTNWLIRQRITESEAITSFTQLGYSYRPELSQPDSPVFVCADFGGIGLSVRDRKTS